MDSYSKISDEIVVVVVGSFNPSIFQPQWFLRHELVPEEDFQGNDFKIEVVHNNLSQFRCAWFSFEVTPRRLTIRTSDMSRSEDLRDLLANLFNILCETPVELIGLNKISSFKCINNDFWHKVGYAISPRELWLKAIPEANSELGGVGLMSSEIKFSRWDDMEGYIMVTTYPSNYPPNPEVSIKVNDHIDFEKMSQNDNKLTLHSFLLSYWEDSMLNSDRFGINILKEISNA